MSTKERRIYSDDEVKTILSAFDNLPDEVPPQNNAENIIRKAYEKIKSAFDKGFTAQYISDFLSRESNFYIKPLTLKNYYYKIAVEKGDKIRKTRS